jgi:hypothetical protein
LPFKRNLQRYILEEGPPIDAQSFEDKLKAVKESGAAVRQARAAAGPTLMDGIVAGQDGRGMPSMGGGGGKSIYDVPSAKGPGGITIGELGEKTKDDEAGLCKFANPVDP